MLQLLQKEGDLQKGGDTLRPTRQPLKHASAVRITEPRPASSQQGDGMPCLAAAAQQVQGGTLCSESAIMISKSFQQSTCNRR